MEEKKKKTGFMLIFVAIASLLVGGACGYFLYEGLNGKNNNTKKEEITEKKDETKKTEDKKQTVECTDCVTKINLIGEDEGKEFHVLLNNNISTIIMKDSILYLDGKEIFKEDSLEHGITAAYVISNKVLVVEAIATDIHTRQLYAYDKDLKETELVGLNVGLGDTEQAIDEVLFIDEDSIYITADAIWHGPTYGGTTVCNYDTGKLLNGMLKKYKGQPVSSIYKIKYLGDGKFSKWKQIKVLSTFDENFCSPNGIYDDE